jgi:hypothetical protein
MDFSLNPRLDIARIVLQGNACIPSLRLGSNSQKQEE